MTLSDENSWQPRSVPKAHLIYYTRRKQADALSSCLPSQHTARIPGLSGVPLDFFPSTIIVQATHQFDRIYTRPPVATPILLHVTIFNLCS